MILISAFLPLYFPKAMKEWYFKLKEKKKKKPLKKAFPNFHYIWEKGQKSIYICHKMRQWGKKTDVDEQGTFFWGSRRKRESTSCGRSHRELGESMKNFLEYAGRKRKAKAQLELKLATAVEEKNSFFFFFYKYINS